MADEVGEIRARINIVDLVGQTVALRKVGNRFQGLCPFHQDHNPSFHVSPETGRYRCWSCGESGDIFNWVMKTRNMDFKDALHLLAEQAGVTLARQNPKERSTREIQRSAMAAALQFFRDELKKSSDAKSYCERRGLGQTFLTKWELGYAPELDEALTSVLLKQGFRLADCKALFLVEGDEANGYRSKFRSRLMFPIRDEKEDLVAFGGRVLGEGQPKYINSSDTPLYKKSKVLYGMHVAKEAMRRSRSAVLVEGYLDVIACHSAGVETAVASLGTSFAEDQARLLKRWCDSVTILYDSDEAGQKAAVKAAEMLAAESIRVKIAAVPEGKDPDTLLRSLGAEAVQKAAAGGLTPLEYRIRRLQASSDLSQDEFWKAAAQEIAKEASEFERLRFIEDLAPKHPHIRDAAAARAALLRSVELYRRGVAPTENPPSHAVIQVPNASVRRLFDGSEMVILRALIEPDYRQAIWSALQKEELFITKTARIMAKKITRAFPEGAPAGVAREWLETIEDSRVKDLLLSIEELDIPLSQEYVQDAINNLYRKLDKRNVETLKGQEGDERLAAIQRLLQAHKT